MIWHETHADPECAAVEEYLSSPDFPVFLGMFGGYTEVAAYYVNTQWPEGADGDDMDVGHPPADYLPQYFAPDPWHQRAACQQDFILIAEFSEQEGPKPLITIPTGAGGSFDLNDFSVRLMSVDYQTIASESFSPTEDTHLLISESQNGIHAYVHHFTLHDTQARGFVRPFCMSYVTPDHSKLFSIYEELTLEFARVSHCFKYGNLLLFVRDMTHRLSDLQYTKERFLERENFAQDENSADVNHFLNEDDDLEEDAILRSATLQSINYAIEEVKVILETASSLMNDRELESQFDRLEERSKLEPSTIRGGGSGGGEEDSFDVENFRYSCSLHNNSPRLAQDQHFLRDRAGSVSELDHSWTQEDHSYKPKVVQITNRKRFDRSLRTLHELCQWGSKEGLGRLRALHKYFSRDMCTLLLEKSDADLIDPSSSLLTIGQNVEVNFTRCTDLGRNNILTADCDGIPTSNSMQGLYKRWFSSDTLASFHSAESYLSCREEISPVKGPRPSQLFSSAAAVPERKPSEANGSSVRTDLDKLSSVCSDEGICSAGTMPDADKFSFGSLTNSVCGSSQDNVETPDSHMNGRAGPRSKAASRNEIPVTAAQPSISSCADHVCSLSPSSPGYGILQFVHDYPFSAALIYSLLRGRPVVVVGSLCVQADVLAAITTLSLFIPGLAGSSRQVLPWHSLPLTVADLPRSILIGLCKPEKKTVDSVIPRAVKRYVTILDLEKKALWAPPYSGGIVSNIYNKRKSFQTDQSYIAYIHGELLEVASKSFVFYHKFCLRHPAAGTGRTGDPLLWQRSKYSKAATELLTSKLKFNSQDAKIVQYLVEVVKSQQMEELMGSSPSDTETYLATQIDYTHSRWYRLH